MGRKRRVNRSPEEQWQVVQEGISGGNVQRRVGVTGSLPIFITPGRMKRSKERRQRLGGEALPPRKPRKITASAQLERTLARKALSVAGHWLRTVASTVST